MKINISEASCFETFKQHSGYKSLIAKHSMKINWQMFEKNLWPLFMDGVQLSQGYRVTTKRQFTFYHSRNYMQIENVREFQISVEYQIYWLFSLSKIPDNSRSGTLFGFVSTLSACSISPASKKGAPKIRCHEINFSKSAKITDI